MSNTEYIVSASVALCTHEKGKRLSRGEVFKVGDYGVTEADVKEWKSCKFVQFYAGQALEDSIAKDEQIHSMKRELEQLEALKAENAKLKAEKGEEAAEESSVEEVTKDEIPNGSLDFDPAALEPMEVDDLNLMIATVCAEHGVEPKEYKRKDYAIKFLSRDFQGE